MYSSTEPRAKTEKPPVGTIGGRPDHGHSHYPYGDDHIHLFRVNRTPYPECKCWRNRAGAMEGSQLPPGMPYVQDEGPAGGGGPEE